MENLESDSHYDKISVDAPSAVNNLILDYYKKFGRKRDLEQFFSLSTAQSEIRDPTGTFWRKMKSQNDSSDSGEKKSESSTELCRISIKCSIPERPNFQSQEPEESQKSDSESPPIIMEEGVAVTSRDVEEESDKSDDIHSQRSNEANLDTSLNKPHSPTSSITSQRKLEWDSLADVGYANETDRRTSASSLSTLERLALKQQYSHNDSRQNIEIGNPTSHSTPVDEADTKCKGKRGYVKKITKLHQKAVDHFELNVPHGSQTNMPQAISVNLSKHISFNVKNDGEIHIDNIERNVSVSPEKVIESENGKEEKHDKEIQTTLKQSKEKFTNLTNTSDKALINAQKYPVLISLNTLRNRSRKKKLKKARKTLRNKKKSKIDKENMSQGKTTEQVSEAESFEYMPGHIYNQNHMKINQIRAPCVDNKSSLESSAGLTTDSSKGSKRSFSKDLENSIELLRTVLQQHNNDATLKKKLIKEVVQRLIKSKYKDDESSTDFLSGLSINSKAIGLSDENHTTSCTSDANNTDNVNKLTGPKKSILRRENFNSVPLASTSQSAPNLPSVSNSERPITCSLTKPVLSSNTDSDMSNKEKSPLDVEIGKTSSEELYKKYLEALQKEEAYKKYLKNRQKFVKQKLVSSETAITQLAQADLKTQNKLKSLLKDLTRNNYDDGAGDASKLEGYMKSKNITDANNFLNKPRSHSVFTLSSGTSDDQFKKSNCKNKTQTPIHDSAKQYCRKDEYHYCCCPYHKDHAKIGVTDSAVQVNISNDIAKEKMSVPEDTSRHMKCMKCMRDSTRVVTNSETGDLKFICMCSAQDGNTHKVPENFFIYKCSKLVNKSVQLGDSLKRNPNVNNDKHTKDIQECGCQQKNDQPEVIHQQYNHITCINPRLQDSKSSQTNINLNPMLQRKSSMKSVSSQSSDCLNLMQCFHNGKFKETSRVARSENNTIKPFIHETVRTVQTEISINPRISDPSLSDINIINDKDCVKVISEHYKEIIKSNNGQNTENRSSEKDFPVSTVNSSMSVVSKTSAEKLIQDEMSTESACCNTQMDKEIQPDPEPIHNMQNTNTMKHFTIPIQGTNMTLKVNLGMNNPNNIDMKSQGIVTEKMNLAEEFTSLRDDCTKAVQCTDATIFPKINQDNVKQNPHNVNDCKENICSMNVTKYNTYPKVDKIIRKPLLRTNTDVGKFEALKSLQFEGYEKSDDGREFIDNYQKVESARSDRSDKSNKSCKSDKTDKTEKSNTQKSSKSCSPKCCKDDDEFKIKELKSKPRSNNFTSESDSHHELTANKDPLLDIIQDITKRYSKKDIDRSKRKKCFKEIMSILNYLLDTEDSTDEHHKESCSNNCIPSDQKHDNSVCDKEIAQTARNPLKTFVDKEVQLSMKKSKSSPNKCCNKQTTENTVSTDCPPTSSDSATCKVLNKIKKECEKYHQQRCKSHNSKKACDTSSTTSVNCKQCNRIHYCYCSKHKCRSHKKATEKPKKKCVAYNLILQTSDSVVSEETVPGNYRHPLKSIIVKVPSKKTQCENIPFREMSAKLEKNMPHCGPHRTNRSRSLPNESDISSTEEFLRKAQTYTVREYLERNRPDFVDNCCKRQHCLKVINETRQSERNSKRKLLSLQLDRQQALSTLTDEELRQFAVHLSGQLRRKKVAPKFISEREMKKHSEKIYKSLPEVTRKKEELKKENIKKTNLLMANIFKKNLQKKTLRGSVNLSNYSTVIKI